MSNIANQKLFLRARLDITTIACMRAELHSNKCMLVEISSTPEEAHQRSHSFPACSTIPYIHSELLISFRRKYAATLVVLQSNSCREIITFPIPLQFGQLFLSQSASSGKSFSFAKTNQRNRRSYSDRAMLLSHCVVFLPLTNFCPSVKPLLSSYLLEMRTRSPPSVMPIMLSSTTWVFSWCLCTFPLLRDRNVL